jgi:hypothetical protein
MGGYRLASVIVAVSAGKVAVTDLVRHRTVVVHAGQSYLARALARRR